MSRYFIIPLFALFSLSLFSQTVPKESIEWEVDTDGNLINLRYKISGVKEKKPYLGVFVDAKGEVGVVPIIYATGDIGPGIDNDESREKEISFDPIRNGLEDLGNLEFKFDVVSFPAEYARQGEVRTAPVRQIPYAAATVLGAGAGIYALSLFGASADLYDTYESERNPYAPVYDELSRDDHFEGANQKYLNAQILAYGGGVLLVAGATFWIDHQMRRYNWKKMRDWSLGLSEGGIGLSINLQKK